LKWLKNVYQKTGAYELKVVEKGKALPFSALAPHQKSKLQQVKHSTFEFKIPDLGNQNPFDCFMFVKEPAWVVVMFHKERQNEFYMCSIDSWCEEEAKSGRKSLTEERAKEICAQQSFNN
jgi:penicillin-binding protein-related factor A (putative recombinase)